MGSNLRGITTRFRILPTFLQLGSGSTDDVVSVKTWDRATCVFSFLFACSLRLLIISFLAI